jgi:uncharacterized membrane protein YeaQ/YmgE (transglycosylase-associated protein family)
LGAYTPFIMLAVIGLIAGWITGMLFGQRGLIRYLLVGVIGAIVGGYLVYDVLKINFGIGNAFLDQVAVATVGAILVTLLARAIAR